MIEKLFPIELPPGFQNNGTTYQAKGRWHAGNLVRFFQGNKQPIGGWVQRITTGATITGVPNAAHSWQLNDGSNYLAIGTTSNLYVVNGSNVVFDITPANVAGDGLTHLWQLDNFGQDLVATFDLPIGGAHGDNLYIWEGNTAVLPTHATLPGSMPNGVFGVCTTPERFLVALRGADGAFFNAVPLAVAI